MIMGDVGKTIIEVGKYFSTVLSTITLITLIVKPIRNRFVKWIRNTSGADTTDSNAEQITALNGKIDNILSELNKSKQNDLCMIRHMITQIYYANMGSPTMHSREKEDMEFLYSRYEAMGGNSYVKQIVNEMRNKETVV